MNDLARVEAMIHALAAHLGVDLRVCRDCHGNGETGPYYRRSECERCDGRGIEAVTNDD